MKKCLCQILLLVAEVYPLLVTGVLAWLTWSWNEKLSILFGSLFVLIYLVLTTNLICKRGQFKRISSFFTVTKIPFFKCSVLAQNVCKKDLKNKDCNAIFQALRQTELHRKTLKQLRPNWNYITFTHDTVIDIIKSSEMIDADTFREIMDGGKATLTFAQDQILGWKCWLCKKKKQCSIRRAGQRKRHFGFISFRTK